MKWRWFWRTLVLLWCIQIFFFTALPVYNDAHTRGFLTKVLMGIFPNSGFIGVIDYYIRKSAHVTVFGILAVLSRLALDNKKRSYLFSWIFTAFYAATDEFHQRFVPGRTASIYDVLIDSTGAFVFLLLMFILTKVKNRESGRG